MIDATCDRQDDVEKGVRVKTRDCPRYRRQGLITTGVYSVCGVCSSAMTQAALLIDQADTQVRNRLGQADSRTRDHTTL